MRFAAVCSATLLFVVLPTVAQDQATSPMTRQEKDQILDVHVSSRPKLPLQDALKVVEEFISSENIDASYFWPPVRRTRNFRAGICGGLAILGRKAITLKYLFQWTTIVFGCLQ